MKKDLVLTFAITLVAIALAFGLIRLFAPWLLPVARDMRIVQEDKVVAPFYDNIFLRGKEETGPDHYAILDPVLKHRAPSLYPDRMGIGPNDLLGFRNRSVPNVADMVAIGSSTTYGNNAVLEQTWPSQVARMVSRQHAVIYNMSTGGWGPVQFLAAFDYALRFQPKVIVVAFNGANDSLTAVMAARNIPRWKPLLDGIDVSKLEAEPGMDKNISLPDKAAWKVVLKGGHREEFAPRLRLVSNHRKNFHARLGYLLMAKIGGLMVEKARKAGVHLVFTTIPTKELSFRSRLEAEGIALDDDYKELVKDELLNIEELRASLEASGGEYVDLVTPMQHAVESRNDLFPFNESHPFAEGYGVIAAAIAQHVNRYLPGRIHGFVGVRATKDYGYDEVFEGMAGSAKVIGDRKSRLAVYFVDDAGAWLVRDPAALHGLDIKSLPTIDSNEIQTLPMMGFYAGQVPAGSSRGQVVGAGGQ